MIKTFIKFKSEHEKFISVMLDCYHVNFNRKKAVNLGLKMLTICLYLLS